MHPVVTTLHLGGVTLPIYSYGLLVAWGAAIGAGWWLFALCKQGHDPGEGIAILGATACGALLGARGLGWWVALAEAGQGSGGLVFYGGLLGGALAGWVAVLRLGWPVGVAADAAALPLCIGHAVGRLGCLLGGCCYGKPFTGPWAIRYPHFLTHHAAGVLRHPVPVYEACLLCLLAVALGRAHANHGPGGRALHYLWGYGALRFAVESLRGDAERGLLWGGLLSTSQAIGAGMMVLALVALAWRRPDRWGTPGP